LSDVEYSAGLTEPPVPDKQLEQLEELEQLEQEQDFNWNQERGQQDEMGKEDQEQNENIEPVESIEPGVETVNISEPVLDYRSNIFLEGLDIREVSTESTQCYKTESNYLRTGVKRFLIFSFNR